MKKQSLFEFVTIAKPQLVTEDQKQLGFVYHPDPLQSDFLSTVTSAESHIDIHNALHTEATNFTPLSSYGQVKAISPDLFEFSVALANQETPLILSELQTLTNGLTVLDSSDLATLTDRRTLWDNLFYQVIKNTDNSVADAIIRLLNGNYFLTEFLADTFGSDFSEEQSEKYERLKRSVVVIPKKIGVRKTGFEESNETLEDNYSPALHAFQEVSIAKTQAGTLDDALKEIQRVRDQWEKENSEKIKAWNNTEYGKKSNDSNYKLVEFVPKASDLYNYSYFHATTNDAAADRVFQEYDDGSGEHQKIVANIKDRKKKIFEALTDAADLGDKTVLMNGTSFNLRSLPGGNSISAKLVPSVKDKTKFNLYITQFYLNPDGKARRVQASIVPGSGTSGSHAVNQPIAQTKNFASFELFPNGLDIAIGSESEITLEITLQNGTTYNTTIKLITNESRMKSVRTGSSNGSLVGEPETRMFGVTNLGIAKFRRVEQELCKYIEGEVSHIENIMAREYKERSTRSMTKNEVIDEFTSEEEIENQTDTSTTDRFEMQSEVQRSIEELSSRDFGWSVGVSATFLDSVSLSADAFGNFSNSTSTSQSNSDAVTQAQEITEKTVQRIQQKVKTSRTSRMIREFEENNRHGFDNKLGDNHVTAIYRWVDKVYKNYLVNYGQRMMLEFMIPEPAKNFKASLRNIESVPSSIELISRPPRPADIGLSSPEDLTLENISFFAGIYGAETSEFPVQEVRIAKSYADTISGTPITGYHLVKSYNDFVLPDGYECKKVVVDGGLQDVVGDGAEPWPIPQSPEEIAAGLPQEFVTYGYPKGELSVGGRGFSMNTSLNIAAMESLWYPIEDILPVSLRTEWAGSFNFNIVAFCGVKPSHLAQWKTDAYNQIIIAYELKREAYNQQMASLENVELNELTINPAFSRSIEAQEIKRVAIELMTKPFEIITSRNNFESPDENNISAVNASFELEKQASYARFFEQAFEWEIMAYNFYPYYYANKEKWHELMNSSNNADSIFQAFLQSGMAKSIVPVRKGYEHAVNLFLETGVIWNGNGYTLETEDDLYLSVEQELVQDPITVDQTWESIVPTSLKIIQKDSTALTGDGLPNVCENENEAGLASVGENNTSPTLSPSDIN